MKRTAILLSILLGLFGTVSYAANVGDIVGGYPAGYNSNDPGDFIEHVGEPITPVFTPSTTAQPPAVGFMAGPLPVGFSYERESEFLEDLEDLEIVDREARTISMKRSAMARDNTFNFADNLTVVVTGKDQYYVGYKLVTIAW
jgi:hypothetical protein